MGLHSREEDPGPEPTHRNSSSPSSCGLQRERAAPNPNFEKVLRIGNYKPGPHKFKG